MIIQYCSFSVFFMASLGKRDGFNSSLKNVEVGVTHRSTFETQLATGS